VHASSRDGQIEIGEICMFLHGHHKLPAQCSSATPQQLVITVGSSLHSQMGVQNLGCT